MYEGAGFRLQVRILELIASDLKFACHGEERTICIYLVLAIWFLMLCILFGFQIPGFGFSLQISYLKPGAFILKLFQYFYSIHQLTLIYAC